MFICNGASIADFGRWVLDTPTGVNSLEFVEMPLFFSFGLRDVPVRIYTASLKPRDLAVINVSLPLHVKLHRTN